MSFTFLTTCPLCESADFKRIYTTRDRHYGITDNYHIEKCLNCSLVFLNPMPTQQHLDKLYPETYYAYQDFFDNPGFFKKIYRKYFINIKTKDPEFSKAGSMLDIGCGTGKYLYTMKMKGWNVSGVEINKNAAKLGNDLGQLNIYPGDLLSANFSDNTFDYIRSNHSFEHIRNPNEVLREVFRILKPGGKLLIGVPNIDSLQARIFKEYWWYLGAPTHTFNYTVSTLSQMLQKHGFKIDRVTFNSDYTGILGSLQIYMNRNNPNLTSKDGFFINNKLLILLTQRIVKILNYFKIGDAIEIICTK